VKFVSENPKIKTFNDLHRMILGLYMKGFILLRKGNQLTCLKAIGVEYLLKMGSC